MRYPGGKGRSYQRIINCIPPHSVYVEAHLGGASVMRFKRPAARQVGIDLDPRVIEQWRRSGALPCELVEGDCVTWLRSNPLPRDAVCYLDPPYLWETRRRPDTYRFEYDDSDHDALLSVATELRCRVLISGYPSRKYQSALFGWTQVTYQAVTQRGLRTESLWFNYDPPASLHDSRYIGNTFRERELSRRRLGRLERRIGQLPAVEQQALIERVAMRLAPPAVRLQSGGAMP